MNRFLTLLFFLCLGSLSAQDIFDINQVREVKIEFEDEKWNDVLDSLKQNGENERLIGKVVFNGMTYDSVGIRYKGNSSYFNVVKTGSSKLPFNLKFNFVKKDQLLPGGYKTLKLSNIFRDPSFIREVLSYEIARDYMPASKANYVKVIVNGTPLGIYNATESVDKIFLANHFNGKDGALIKCDPTWGANSIKGCTKGDKAELCFLGDDSLCYEGYYELKSDEGWDQLINLTQVLNESPDRIDKFLNVDQTLWMHAFNNVIVNLDSYSGRLCHNYYLYQDTFGVFHPIIWDMNLSFGGFRFDGSKDKAMTDEEMQKWSMFTHYKSPNRPLISQLLKNSLYRKIYLAHIRTILDDHFVNQQYVKRIEAIQNMVAPHIKNDENKLYDYAGFRANVDSTVNAGGTDIIGIKELMEPRVDYLTKHPLMKKKAPAISEVSHLEKEDQIVIKCRVDEAETVYLFYRNQEKGPFKQIELKDNGQDEDKTSGDGIYTISLDRKDQCQYYIVGEGERLASLSPARAAFEFHEYNSPVSQK